MAGVAWELGILLGLHDTGVDVRGADIIIGTSAGSVVGAQIASGTDLESLFASQLTPVEQSKERRVAFDANQMIEAFSQAVAGAGPDLKAMRARDRARCSFFNSYWIEPAGPGNPPALGTGWPGTGT